MKHLIYLRGLLFFIFLSLSLVTVRGTVAGTAGKITDYEAEYTAALNDTSQIPVSELLMGFNLVYPQDGDSIWQDGKVEGYLQDVNTSILRWPGCTVSTYYYWNDLYGIQAGPFVDTRNMNIVK